MSVYDQFRLLVLFLSVVFSTPSNAQLSDAEENSWLRLPGSGAVCDGVTDDSAAINSALRHLNRGGMVLVAPNSFCLINSANLIVPPNVRIQGASGPNATNPLYANGSGFMLNPKFTISLKSGSSLEYLLIKRVGLISNPSTTQVINAVQSWGREESAGVTVGENINGVTIDHVFIIGFNTCMKFASGAFSLSHIWGDCFNGLEITTAGDNHYVDDVRFEPIYGLNTNPTSGAWARPGVAFNLHDGNTGGVLTRTFSFMYANGLLINDIGVTQVTDSGWEWQAAMGNNTPGTVAVRWINHNAQTSLSNVYANGFSTPLSDEGVGEVIISNPSVAGAVVTGFYLGGETAIPVSLTIAAKFIPGDSVNMQIHSDVFRHSIVRLSYTATAGDSPNKVAQRLANIINTTQELINVRFFASVVSNTVTIFWPLGTVANITAAPTSSIEFDTKAGSPQAGSYGGIYGANLQFHGVPAFTLGKSTNKWLIEAPYFTAYPGWIAIPDDRAVTHLVVRGITYPHPNISNLSKCGYESSIDPSGSDEKGLINEGTLASGCIFTFSVPFYKVPYCIVTSPSGNSITSYRATTTQLIIENPPVSGAQFVYQCDP